uniref:Uncharacterized protein n=1 Tax=Parascaris univalens TaxID=6257 RepID=A0A915C1M5_PARUN
MAPGDGARGWNVVQKNLSAIVDYGRAEGILPSLEEKEMNMSSFPISGMAVLNAAQESREKRRGADEKLNLTVSEVSVIHSAIPFLPLPAAITCLVFNIFLPGAVQYRDALIQRRQEAIATAALEALTRNSVLHRRDVKTLIRENRDKNEKNNSGQ